ncbi:MAG: CDC27 family protein [Pseudomonadales bacterium]|nr:CDC27 family protein [Pseudomonadales bacterium]
MSISSNNKAGSIAFMMGCLVMALLTSACTNLATANRATVLDQQPQTLGAACQRALDQTHGLIQQQRVAEAEYDLLTTAKQSCNSGYEADQLLRLLAYAFSHQQKYPKAIEAYEKLVASQYLDLVTRSEAIYTLAQIHYLQGDYQRVISQLVKANARELLVDDGLQVLVARSYYHRAETAKAQAIMDTIIEQAVATDQVMKEAWLIFSWHLYLDTQSFEQALRVGDQLMAHYPSDQHRYRLRQMCQRGDLLSLCRSATH